MPITVNQKTYASMDDFVQQGRGCATHRPNQYQISRNDERLRRVRAGARPEAIEIPIHFVHITVGERGKITAEQRQQQVDVLNAAYSHFGIHFVYAEDEVVFVDNPHWYAVDVDSRIERELKTKLQKPPTEYLNFYTAGLVGSLLGWATFPWDLDAMPEFDGVVMLDESLPGGTAAPFNLGKTAVHEVGHWLGLFHTFESGCRGYGDHVADTPAHDGPNFDEPAKGKPHNACNSDEFAPIHNYMNYVNDVWMDEFTPLQQERVWKHIQEYRPELMQRERPKTVTC